MKVTYSSQQLVVMDDFVAADHFPAVCEHVAARAYPGKLSAIAYKFKYALSSAIYLTGKGAQRAPDLASEIASRRVVSPLPTGDMADLVTNRFDDIADLIQATIGPRDESWFGYTREMCRAKAGAGLHWHTDGDYCGAYVFYASHHWDADWGGELCMQNTSQPNLRSLSQGEKVELLDAGTFFVPRPNRMVLIKGGTPHKVMPIDTAAGVPRHTVFGFFLNEKALKQRERQLMDGYRNAPAWRCWAVNAAHLIYKG